MKMKWLTPRQRSRSKGAGGTRKRGGLKDRKQTKKKKHVIMKEDLIVSLSLGAPVHCPVVSVRPEPDPPRRRPAAANTESSSSLHPESLYLPLLTDLFAYLGKKKTIAGLYRIRRLSCPSCLVCSD